MRLGKLLAYFKTSPALRLLHATNAPFILDFFDRAFKQPRRISVPHSDLLAALVAYQEELQETHPDVLTSKADSYLTDWCSPDSRWLQRLLETGRDEPVYQLTPSTEDVFGFLDRVLDKDLGFVGTESRLKLVMETLADLVVHSTDDPQIRLRHLRAEQDRIQREIAEIEAGGGVKKYQPAQIRERFATAVTLLRQLQGDFRAVEESFRQITLQVQQRQSAGADSRGGILQFALDAEDLLKKEDQGVSFYAFVALILSPRQIERLEQTIRQVRQIADLSQQQEGLESIRGMVTLLQAEAEKVMRTNQRLSATLRRLLDVRAHAERQRVACLLRAIQGRASELAGVNVDIGLDLDVELAIESPLRRGFWSEPPRLAPIDLTLFEPDSAARLSAFRQLAALRNIDWHSLRLRIRQALAVEEAPTLAGLNELHPILGGVVEVIAYFQIAADDGHSINPLATETLTLRSDDGGEPSLKVVVPQLTFHPKRRISHAR